MRKNDNSNVISMVEYVRAMQKEQKEIRDRRRARYKRADILVPRNDQPHHPQLVDVPDHNGWGTKQANGWAHPIDMLRQCKNDIKSGHLSKRPQSMTIICYDDEFTTVYRHKMTYKQLDLIVGDYLESWPGDWEDEPDDAA